MSHPMWVRGLKRQFIEQNFAPQQVAPHVGAWIETPNVPLANTPEQVAPHVGAWIETSYHLYKSMS